MSSSLRSNIVANYVGQLYMAVASLLFLPFQVRLLGSEAYGLVGFFTVLTGWLQLLDVGMSTTLARETAQYRAGALPASRLSELLRVLEAAFVCVGGGVALVIAAVSNLIARHWLHPVTLSTNAVRDAVALMGVVFAVRWQANISRSVLVGLERQVLVNVINIGSSTFRSIVVLAVLRLVPTAQCFFLYQAAIAAAELLILRTCARRLLQVQTLPVRSLSLEPLRRIGRFSLSVAMTTLLWLLVTQLDKLLLSSMLPLSEYAWFSLAVTAASGINILAGPIGQAVQPRLTFFQAEKNEASLRVTYAETTQLLSAVALTAAFVIAAAARPLLWAWTGNADFASRAAPVLAFYALGNGQLAIVSMTYYLQVARGDLKLHIRGSAIFAFVLVPLIASFTLRWGMLGAAVAWCIANVGYLFVWSAIVHRRFLPRYHFRWTFRDALLPAATGLVPALLAFLIPWAALSRLATACALVGLGGVAACTAGLTTKPVWRFVRRVTSLEAH